MNENQLNYFIYTLFFCINFHHFHAEYLYVSIKCWLKIEVNQILNQIWISCFFLLITKFSLKLIVYRSLITLLDIDIIGGRLVSVTCQTESVQCWKSTGSKQGRRKLFEYTVFISHLSATIIHCFFFYLFLSFWIIAGNKCSKSKGKKSKCARIRMTATALRFTVARLKDI